MRPAIETWEEAQQRYWQFEPFITTTNNAAADSAAAAAIIEADRAALVAEICEWLETDDTFAMTNFEISRQIQVKWGRPE